MNWPIIALPAPPEATFSISPVAKARGLRAAPLGMSVAGDFEPELRQLVGDMMNLIGYSSTR